MLGPIAASGVIKKFYVSLDNRLVTGETVTSVNAAVTNANGVHISNAAPTTATVPVAGTDVSAGRAIEFTVTTANVSITEYTVVECSLTYTTSLSNREPVVALLQVVPKVTSA